MVMTRIHSSNFQMEQKVPIKQSKQVMILFHLIQNKNINFNILLQRASEKDFLIENDKSELSLILKKLMKINQITYSKNHRIKMDTREKDIENLNIKVTHADGRKITKVLITKN